jgi:hypothetical protein
MLPLLVFLLAAAALQHLPSLLLLFLPTPHTHNTHIPHMP